MLTPNSDSSKSEENLSQTLFLNPDISLDFKTNQEKNISVNGATISFAKNSFSEDIIHIDASYHDSNISTSTLFPADFKAVENNQTFPINSYGFFRVQLKDAQGDKATLLQNAQLLFPIPKADNNPQTLSLWHYDASLKVWEESGTAILNAAQNAYITEVSHFTYWSIGEKKAPARLKGCLQDSNAVMIEDATLTLSTKHWYAVTNSTNRGSFDFSNILAEETLTLAIFVNDVQMHQEISPLQANEIREMRECILFTADKNASHSSTISGHLLDDNNQTISNATVTLAIDGTNTSTTSDDNGTFSFSLNSTLLSSVESFRLTAIKPQERLSGNLNITIEADQDFSNLILRMRQAPAF